MRKPHSLLCCTYCLFPIPHSRYDHPPLPNTTTTTPSPIPHSQYVSGMRQPYPHSRYVLRIPIPHSLSPIPHSPLPITHSPFPMQQCVNPILYSRYDYPPLPIPHSIRNTYRECVNPIPYSRSVPALSACRATSLKSAPTTWKASK